MEQAKVAQKSPIAAAVEAGKTYHWCACGLSRNQPFCDGSHKGSGFAPVHWQAPTSEVKHFCACKRTRNRPLCDGSHKSLE